MLGTYQGRKWTKVVALWGCHSNRELHQAGWLVAYTAYYKVLCVKDEECKQRQDFEIISPVFIELEIKTCSKSKTLVIH